MLTNNTAPNLITTPKMLDALAVVMNPNNRLVAFEGTVRAIKTVTAIIGFHYRVQASKAKFHLIAGRNLETIRRNLLEAELGLVTMFPERYKMVKGKIGSYFIQAVTPTGIKEIILTGYSDKSRWENLTGGSIENIFLDEVNLADEQFLDECFARQIASLSPFTIFTLNGDDPNAKCYQDYINRCRIVGDCPASTRSDMDKVEKARGYRYMFFTFYDNPIMTPRMIKAAETVFPTGSYYYKTRTLGERGAWGVMIYADYMSEELFVDAYERDAKGRLKYELTTFAIGGDIAENRASNVYALIGFTKDFTTAILLDIIVFASTSANGQRNGYKFKTEMLKGFLQRHNDKRERMRYIAIDSAEGNYINDLRGSNLGVQVIPSYKATIKERIDMNIILFSGKRFLFHRDRNTNTEVAFKAFQSAKWADGKEGKEREDLNQTLNDIMDAIEYAETKYMTALTTGKGRDHE